MKSDEELGEFIYVLFKADKNGVWPWSKKIDSTKRKWIKRAQAIRLFLEVRS